MAGGVSRLVSGDERKRRLPLAVRKNLRLLRDYLEDKWPISEISLHARLRYEELLKNLRRRAEAAG